MAQPAKGKARVPKATVEDVDEAAPRAEDPHAKLQIMECGHSIGGRNLVICIDGTANQFGDKNTNVVEMYHLVKKDPEDNQLSFYHSGIGTYARPSWRSWTYYKKVISHTIDMAIAWDFERTVQGAYRWLCDHYQPGDTIFLFGFSRGAYQVRALSAMIDTVGLLYPGNELQIPFAYELYADSDKDRSLVTKVGQTSNTTGTGETDEASANGIGNSGMPKTNDVFTAEGTQAGNTPNNGEGSSTIPPGNTGPRIKDEVKAGARNAKATKAERFKEAFSRRDVSVHFVGVWDTVSSIGLVRGKRLLPRTNDGMKHVCFFRHALALDERRVKFLPEYAYGGTNRDPSSLQSEPSTGKHTSEKPPRVPTSKAEPIRPQTLEVWFAGTHSDIGGGNALNEWMNNNRPALRWMVFEAGSLGLRMAPFQRELKPEELISVQESLTTMWRVLEIFPLKRLTFSRNNAKVNTTTYKPHLGRPRKIHKGQKIHSSFVLGNRETVDSTKNLGMAAARYRPKALPPDNDGDFWGNFSRSQNWGEWAEVDMYTLANSIVASFLDDHDSEAKLESLHSLRNFGHSDDGRQAIYDAIMNGLETGHASLDAKHHLLLSSIKHLKVCLTRSLIRKTSTECRRLLGDLLNDSDRDRRRTAWRFLEAFADPCMQILSGHTSRVSSVACSSDGKQIASGSWDRTIRLWDADTGLPIGAPFKEHGHWVHCVAFSPDGQLLASASHNGTVRIWDAATGVCRSVLEGHTDYVCSVAFAPASEQKLVVSGSDDGTVRLWDYETGNAVGEPLEGHSGWARFVAVCPASERKLIASGSDDGTVRLWDYETEPPIQWGEPFTGHSGWWVLPVAFSLDGRYLASGGMDNKICVWDISTKPTQSFQPIHTLRGHTDDVNSVAVSPDSRWIASGSDDWTVRLWDMETGRQVGEPFRGHDSLVWSVAFSPDGKRVASGSSDNTVRIWDVEAAQKLQELQVDDESKTRQN